MSRARTLSLRPGSRAKLETLSSGGLLGLQPRRLRRRASIILALSDGASLRGAAKIAGVSKPTVLRWRHRWFTRGFFGLKDMPRPGNPDFKTERNPRRGPKRTQKPVVMEPSPYSIDKPRVVVIPESRETRIRKSLMDDIREQLPDTLTEKQRWVVLRILLTQKWEVEHMLMIKKCNPGLVRNLWVKAAEFVDNAILERGRERASRVFRSH